MKNTTKYLVTILIITLALVFAAGCTNVEVNASITEDNLVTYTYNILVDDIDDEDINYDEIRLFFLDIKKYWEEQGLDCELLLENAQINLTGTLSRQCENREEAFDTLYEFMTHKTSIFDDVTLNYTEDFYKTNYSLITHLDLSGVIDEDVYEVYPKIVGDDVNDFIDSFKAVVKFSLPTEGVSEQGETMIIQSESSTEVTLEEPVEISLSGNISNIENTESEANLENVKAKSKNAMFISGIIALLSLAGLAVLIIIKRNTKDTDDENVGKEE